MSWIDQGRQYHQWFGHGTAMHVNTGPEPGTLAERVQQAVIGAEALLPEAMRHAREGAKIVSCLLATVPVWAGAAALSPDLFRRWLVPGKVPEASARDFQAVGEALGKQDVAAASAALAAGLGRFEPRKLFYEVSWLRTQAHYATVGGRVPAPFHEGAPVILAQSRGGPPEGENGRLLPETLTEHFRIMRLNTALNALSRLEPSNPALAGLRNPNSVPSEEWVSRIEGEAEAARLRALARAGGPVRPMPFDPKLAGIFASVAVGVASGLLWDRTLWRRA